MFIESRRQLEISFFLFGMEKKKLSSSLMPIWLFLSSPLLSMEQKMEACALPLNGRALQHAAKGSHLL